MKLIYRPEIDGLRAIAVIVVILYHSQITILGHQFFKGGFIGVDIFFVISGYLITSIILKELLITGSFSLKHFYESRIRRILPTLLFVMFVSTPFAYMYLLPSNFEDFSKSIIYSLGFSSNFYFYYSGQQYGAEDALLKPFLHIWSLSVEKQFYILIPIFLLITYKFFRKYLIYILIIFLIVSLLISDWSSRNYPSLNFYMLPTRSWEFIAGSVLAYFEVNLRHRGKFHSLYSILPKIGLLLIFHSILFFNHEMFHPSFYTISPIIGVCLIIWFSNKKELITKILSSKVFMAIGVISYSLYLWHYPIFSFARIKVSDLSEFEKFGLIVLTFVISIVSYFFIERPFRSKKYSFNFIAKLLLITVLTIFIFNLVSILNRGLPERNHITTVINNLDKNLDYRQIYQNNTPCHDRKGDEGFCIFNELPNNIGDIVLLGDSQTDAILNNLIKQISNTKFRLIHMSYSGNLYLPNFTKIEKKTNKIIKDETWHNYRTDFLNHKTHKNTYIIIFGRYDMYFDKNLVLVENNPKKITNSDSFFYMPRNEKNLSLAHRIKSFKNKFQITVENLSLDKKILLLYPIPVSHENISNRVFQNRDKILEDDKFYLNDKSNYSIKFHKKYFFEEIEMLNEINSKNIHKINTEKIFCPKDQCFLYDNKNIYIFDTHHPSFESSKKINDLIIKKIENIELSTN